jgi:ADP-ribose pyrophosphatase YjhB (NUDIX family)
MTLKPIAYKRRMKAKSLYYEFYPTENLLDSKYFQNIKKVRCIALNEDKQVCMVSNDGISYWMVPGGTVERNENPILALKRELEEEADIEIKNYKLIGFMSAEFRNNATGYMNKYTEMWFTAKVSKVHDQTIDPAKGQILSRDFFDIEEMAYKFQNWGKISKYMVEEILAKIK